MREMKDSGIEWLAKIPDTWNILRNKQLFVEVDERCSADDGYTLLSVSEYYGVAPKADKIEEGAFETRAESLDGYKICRPGDIAMNIMLAWKSSTAVSNYEGIISPAYCVYRPLNNCNSHYYHYLFRTQIVCDLFKRYSTGIIDSRLRLYPDKFLSLRFPVPPLPEQQRIADFLDRKCAELDAVMEKTRATIEEYKKLKQSVITEAVTRGVRGPRPMKPSGIEWIPFIPEDISMSRVGLHHNIILGKMLCSEKPDETYTLEPYYCAADVHFDGVANGERKTMWFSPNEKKQYMVSGGDLLVVEGGAGAGGCAIANDEGRPVYVQNSIMIVRAKSMQDNRYLKYLLESLVKQGYIDLVCNKATIPHFTKDKLATVPYPVFSGVEQREIADYLDAKCSELDNLITKKEQYIAELEAFKKSLIFEYVTGKREVG